MQDRFFRWLLWLLPREFRDAYARDMTATFRAERRSVASVTRRFGLWVATAADILRAAPAQHADILARDLRSAWRAMAARPLHTTTAVVTLALGLGASLAMFTVIDTVWLRALPYRDAGALVQVREGSGTSEGSNLGYLTFLDLRGRATTVQAMSAASQSYATITGDGREAERVSVMRSSFTYFDLIGVQPVLGRAFTAEDDRAGPARRVLVISDRLWRRRFAADPSIVNSPLQVNGVTYTIVGVMPAGFQDLIADRFYEGAEMWSPLGYDPTASFACRTCRHLSVFARLAPRATVAGATRELTTAIGAVAAEHPRDYHEPRINIIDFDEALFGAIRPTLVVIAVGVLLLFVVACGNVGNLLLLRASEREHEIAIRTALGVTAGRLARQLVTESLLLAVAGGFAGMPLAWLTIRLVVNAGPAELPRLAEAGLDARAAAIAFVLVVASGLLFSIVPLWQVLRRDIAPRAHGGGRRTASSATWRTRSLLVGANVAIAAILCAGSGLLMRSVRELLAVPLGFSPNPLLTARLALSGPAYSSDDNAKNVAATVRFFDDALASIRALPAVEAAAAVTTLPLGGGVDGFGLHIAGRVSSNPEAAPSADRFVVTPDYFATMGTRLIRGRLLDANDRQQAAAVALINETLAREQFDGEDPLGHQIMLGPPSAVPRTIVGVVADVRHHGVDAVPTFQVYVPQAQWVWAETTMTLLVKTTGAPTALAGSVRAVIGQIDRTQPLTDVRAYSDIVAGATATRRVAAELLTVFAATALLLAFVGLYGALGVLVGQRRREFGVRLALGARGTDIAGRVMTYGLRPAGIGLVLGLAAASALASQVGQMLYGIGSADVLTFGLAALLLMSAAVVACAIPAWRACRINPVVALRTD